MGGHLQRDRLLELLSHASKFTATRIGSSAGLQGVHFNILGKELTVSSTNLNTSFCSTSAIEAEKDAAFLIEPGKIIEFLSYLETGDVVYIIEKDKVVFSQGKTKGSFPFLSNTDFPQLPPTPKDGIEIDMVAFSGIVEKVLFSASRDLSRPVLSGVKFADKDGTIEVVATDGFRLSLHSIKNEVGIKPMLIPAEFILDFLRTAKGAKKMKIYYLEDQKMVLFQSGDERYFSRLIDGEFPPYERVIPTERKTTITVDREELVKKIKIVSVFARDHSSIVVCDFGRGEVIIYPKIDGGIENSTTQECEVEGDPMRVAFNFKFILEFLNTMDKKEIQIQLLRPDAPVVLRQKGDGSYTHIIMPVRIQE